MNKEIESIKVKMELIGELNRLICEFDKIRENFEKEWKEATDELSIIHEKHAIEAERVTAKFTDISQKLLIEMEISRRFNVHEL